MTCFIKTGERSFFRIAEKSVGEFVNRMGHNTIFWLCLVAYSVDQAQRDFYLSIEISNSLTRLLVRSFVRWSKCIYFPNRCCMVWYVPNNSVHTTSIEHPAIVGAIATGILEAEIGLSQNIALGDFLHQENETHCFLLAYRAFSFPLHCCPTRCEY